MSKPDRPSKPVAYFSNVRGFMDVGGFGIRAVLEGVEGHPYIRDLEPVINTSAVLRLSYDAKFTKLVEIETLNTIYRKREVTE